MGIRIGDENLLEELPRRVYLDEKPFILSQTPDGTPVVFEAICPHQGGTVDVKSESCLRCPDHGWEFDSESGESTTVPGESLEQYPVTTDAGTLYADIPHIDPTTEFTVDDHEGAAPTVSLLSHATLRIDYDGFTLLTDPWLDGPAFLGGWAQYPQPTCDIDEVAAETDAIWITHEHSDHLNKRTLSHFPDNTPIYVPELNYRRLSSRLRELGFENTYSLPTGEAYPLAEGIEAACFESQSTWNDSILAVNCGGFRILNFNDAGLNWDVKDAIPSVDLVATSFAFGASGYPLTWNHLSGEEKYEIMDDRNAGALKHCQQVVEMYDPEYLLPFAKFFGLLQPEFDEYRSMIRQNEPSDVVEHLSDSPVEVLDLLPGESWDGNSGMPSRRNDHDKLYDDDVKEAKIQSLYKSHTPIVDEEFDLSHEELSTYFEALGGSSLATEVGNHALSLTLRADERDLHSLIRFQNGSITYTPMEEPSGFASADADTHVRMAVDGELVQHVIRNDLSWDEIHIGYWADFERQPDEYNLSFWRLLHAPWEARDDTMNLAAGYDIETDLSGFAMADLLEQHSVEDLLSEYGLHCAGCPASLGEDIVEAARIHGLNRQQAESLVESVEKVVQNEESAQMS
ncbi:Rieske 2Fe-2S domain-containing protein [Halobacterium jilantaiense]|uniref:Cytidine monophosphate-N-acetylneuraminic acid hydroxylase n=1 Tax=Halobacterium jilantaiense TaxID=355548 RepID=A0A1I0PEZ1_9EURY|nr:Rieske 2Fe-2S domain-containing protein [Halobacterium jilantaiense]SEW12900.1 CMP-N-acetylneuraminate monooxygenase [Halobacterium jilantaiense]